MTPTTYAQKLDMALCACNLIARGMEMGNSEVIASQVSKLQVHK